MIRNGPQSFGLVTRALHWLTAALVLAAAPLGLYIANTQPSLSSLWLFGLHKTLGISVLALVLVRIAWHALSRPPVPFASGVAWKDRLANIVHRMLYVLMIAVPLVGWVASSATGIDSVVLGGLTLPRIAPVSEQVDETGFLIHASLAFLFLAVVALHIAGALLRRDGTLRRMVTGHTRP